MVNKLSRISSAIHYFSYVPYVAFLLAGRNIFREKHEAEISSKITETYAHYWILILGFATERANRIILCQKTIPSLLGVV